MKFHYLIYFFKNSDLPNYIFKFASFNLCKTLVRLVMYSCSDVENTFEYELMTCSKPFDSVVKC